MSRQFETESQAFYCGMVDAFDRILAIRDQAVMLGPIARMQYGRN